ncbi:MAG: L,D-transpeptidase family protein [Clostridia bacterium]|nr:L,D-transpeptidase family protein [Clostridia bacterium]
MKKGIVAILLVLLMVLPFTAMAEGEVFSTVKVHFDAGEIPTVIEDDATLNLYDESGATLLDTKTISVKRGTRYYETTFNVPAYAIGTKFTLSLANENESLVFCGAEGSTHTLETFSYPDENGALINQTSFYMAYKPAFNKEAVIKVRGNDKTLYYHCLTDNEVYVTTDLLDVLGIKCTKNFEAEKPYFTLTSYKKGYSATFYLNDVYAVIGNEALNLDIPSFEINGSPFVPLSKVATYFACNYSLESEDEYTRVISLTASAYSENYQKEEYVNSRDITSRTDYLIWVSKSNFEVSLFKGSNKNWTLVKSVPCAIGAPNTPTVEGSFEYHQYQTRWTYSNYYCGPIMRFYRGYAIHSTLIKYNGVPYDNRVGVKISHGCVRLRPEDINWLSTVTPLYTRVLVTK